MKKIMLSLVLGILVLGFVSATISGMAVSVSEDEGKSFSFNERSYSVAVSESSSGNAYLEVNGEKIENAQAGDSIVVDGAEVIVKKVRKPWLFRKGYKFDLEVKEGSGNSEGEVCYLECGVGGFPICQTNNQTGFSKCFCTRFLPDEGASVAIKPKCYACCVSPSSSICDGTVFYNDCSCSGLYPVCVRITCPGAM